MELVFRGKITEIKDVKIGKSDKGEWASVDFEVTELDAKNPLYAQVALFSFFKNGEYLKFAKDFNTMNKVGDVVDVHFNLKCNKYKGKDGLEKKFYKLECWKLEKVVENMGEVGNGFKQTDVVNDSEPDDLPF
jgi:hypothetical protein